MDKKKLQILEDRYTQIEKDNRLLLERIMNIMQSRSSKKESGSRPKSLNIGKRMRAQENIIRENLQLLKRINDRKSDYSKERIDRQWKQNTKY